MEEKKEVKPRFTVDDIIAAAQKRWRTDVINSGVAQMVISRDQSRTVSFYGSFVDDGETTMAQATTRLLDALRHYLGDKDYVLSAVEVKNRNLRSDALGIGKAFLAELKKGASLITLERIFGQQASLRRIEYPPQLLADSFVRYLKDQQKIFLANPKDFSRATIWKLKPDVAFTDDQLEFMMKIVHRYFRTDEELKAEDIVTN